MYSTQRGECFNRAEVKLLPFWAIIVSYFVMEV